MIDMKYCLPFSQLVMTRGIRGFSRMGRDNSLHRMGWDKSASISHPFHPVGNTISHNVALADETHPALDSPAGKRKR